LKDFFCKIGVIKWDKKSNRDKIWIYKDKSTGSIKGDATITYEDPPTAQAAIDWFDGHDFFGSTIRVERATVKDWRAGGSKRGGRGGGKRGGRGSRGGGGGGGGGW